MAERAEPRRVALEVSPAAARPIVGLCAGKDCRKRCEFGKVGKVLDRHCDVVELKCVRLWDGPVVVTDADGASRIVYSKIRSKQQRALLVGVVGGDRDARKRLAGRRVTKKKGVGAAARQMKRRLGDARHHAA